MYISLGGWIIIMVREAYGHMRREGPLLSLQISVIAGPGTVVRTRISCDAHMCIVLALVLSSRSLVLECCYVESDPSFIVAQQR